MAVERDKAYSLLKEVPRGRVTTYSELARAAGTHPRAVAVLMSTNKNPDEIPCYKVVRSDGSVGGYSAPGGKKRKAELLLKDGIEIRKDKVNLEKHLFRFPKNLKKP